MTDIKIVKKKRTVRQRRTMMISKPLPMNKMKLKCSLYLGPLSSGTTGEISGANGVSISGTSEYSTLQALFTEVKLLRATFIFTGKAQSLASVSQGRIMVGTNMVQNTNNSVTPTGYIDVQNLAGKTTVVSNNVRQTRVKLVVPRSLEYSSITGDSPSTVTPFAGSPGVLAWFGGSFTPSTAYFDLDLELEYLLRGRQ